jgi:hypothetical protein
MYVGEEIMTTNVLLLGRKGIVVDDVQHHLNAPGVRLFGGTSIDDVRSTFAQTHIDHAIMGAGIELEPRLQIVREIFQSSDATTVHMKDRATGPEGFLPFVRAVLHGLNDSKH